MPNTLTVCCESGLSNRLRVALSAVALAEATGRQLRLRWPRTPACGARFDELFEPGLPLQEGDCTACEALPLRHGVGRPLGDLLRAPEPHLALRCPDWLIQPGRYPGHADLYRRCETLWETLAPNAFVREQVASFSATHFRKQMIGIHLRRGDFLRARPDALGSTSHALAAAEKFLARCPDAGLFLCTDDGARDPVTGRVETEGVRERFFERFGDRLVFTQPRSLDRSSTLAVQDALIDLVLLRRADYLVGTRDSSFSAMAAFGRSVEVVLCERGGAYPWIEALGTATGIFPLVQLLGRAQFRRKVPVTILLSYYSGRARATLGRMTGRRRARR